MIPFFPYTGIEVGPLTIQVWGLMVALGILAALGFGSYLVKKYVLSRAIFLDLALYGILGGFVGGRLFHVFLYAPGYYLSHPAEIPAVWHGGASSLGGFVGAAAGVWLFSKLRRFSWASLAPYIDIGVVSLWLGWGIGRIGCFLIHDHPGTLSHFLLAVRYPDGPRHDLGLYDSVMGFVLFGVFWALLPRLSRRGQGVVAAASAGTYAVVRFGLDFLRVTDVPGSDARYAALTPAQWGMLIVAVLTSWFVYTTVKRK